MTRLLALPIMSARTAGSAGLVAAALVLVNRPASAGVMPTVRSPNRLFTCDTCARWVLSWALLPCAPTSWRYRKLSYWRVTVSTCTPRPKKPCPVSPAPAVEVMTRWRL
ncbi:Uncharacterised protein [Bordetella pertussis]|nr:Uncharacterised protein [Bordetella pertussis]